MKVYRISKCNYIADLTGTGASRYPGRWHSKGTYILYTAASPSLAMLESVVHTTTIVKPTLCITGLDIPEKNIKKIITAQLPPNWFEYPAPDMLKSIGDQFIKEHRYLALAVPSAVMPEENNYLLNPAHNDFKYVKVMYTRNVRFDERFFRKD